jgi:hypothetical protein
MACIIELQDHENHTAVCTAVYVQWCVAHYARSSILHKACTISIIKRAYTASSVLGMMTREPYKYKQLTEHIVMQCSALVKSVCTITCNHASCAQQQQYKYQCNTKNPKC